MAENTFPRAEEILKALGEGVDTAAASRIFGHHASTVTRWQRRGAQQTARLYERWVVKLRLNHLQLDELVVRVRALSERIFVWTAIVLFYEFVEWECFYSS